jgi:muramoyltetrapeptide carboxypeptidase
VATVHGNNLMDTPYRPPQGLLSWLDIVAMQPGATFAQTPPNRYRDDGRDDFQNNPEVRQFTLDTAGRWIRLDGDDEVEAEGRLIGGCIETLCNLMGTPYGDVASFARADAPEGLLVFVEAASDDAATICRNLHGMRLAGFFAAANAVLVGRTGAPATASLTQHEAVLDALGGLGIPIIADVECGHVPPYLPIVNGARGHVLYTRERNELRQSLA